MSQDDVGQQGTANSYGLFSPLSNSLAPAAAALDDISLSDLLSCAEGCDEHLFDNVSKTEHQVKECDKLDSENNVKIESILSSEIEENKESFINLRNDNSTVEASKIVDKQLESCKDPLLNNVCKAQVPESEGSEHDSGIKIEDFGNEGNKQVFKDLRSDERRAKDSREVVILAGFVAQRGSEDASILAAKVRARQVLQVSGCLWCEQNVCQTEDDHVKVFQLTCWEDVELFRRWMVSLDSIQFYEENLHMAVRDSFFISEHAQVRNPFYVGKDGGRSFRKVSLLDPSIPQPPAFSVLIELKVRRKRCEEFQRLAWSSETCALQEDECIRYHVFVEWEDANEEQCLKYKVYAVFRSREGFKHHKSQGYSLLGVRARQACTKDPIISFYTRNNLSLDYAE